MLARRLTAILPAMAPPEALDTTRIHCVAGCTGDRVAFVTTRLVMPPQAHPVWGGAPAVDEAALWLDARRTVVIRTTLW